MRAAIVLLGRQLCRAAPSRVQLSGGFALIAIGAVITALMCLVCFCIVKMARGIKSGKQERPQNPVLAPLYDVSAKCAPC